MPEQTVYLDNCCFNRPYDDQTFLSINIETQAKLAIQLLINENEIDLIWSFILDFENSANPDEAVKREIFSWRKKALQIVACSDEIIKKAQSFITSGFGKKDALHIASAVKGNCDYFITVDKGIIKKKNKIPDISICNPIDFISILEEKNEK